MSATPLKGLRLDIALSMVDGQSRPLYEIAKRLGKRSGDVQRAVRGLVEDGVLSPSDAVPSRGTLYTLTDGWAEQVREEFTVASRPGVLVADSTFVLVEAPSLSAFLRALGAPGVATGVAWAAPSHNYRTWLLGLATGLSTTWHVEAEAAFDRERCSFGMHSVREVNDSAQVSAMAAIRARGLSVA